jgi:hypothetical protein
METPAQLFYKKNVEHINHDILKKITTELSNKPNDPILFNSNTEETIEYLLLLGYNITYNTKENMFTLVVPSLYSMIFGFKKIENNIELKYMFYGHIKNKIFENKSISNKK